MKHNIRRLVVKVGTSTLTHKTGALNFHSIDRLARVLTDIKNCGVQVILVTSGAIAVGVKKLGLPERPDELPLKQAAAAVGQLELMHLYDKFFIEYGQNVGQILLTFDEMERPHHKNNLLNTINALLELGVIPIINENDSVSFEEIESSQKVFGDNDTLSAMVAILCDADILALLSDIDGLYDRDPHTYSDAKLLPKISEITDSIRRNAGGTGSARGTGGMITKLQAAQLCLDAGIDMTISNGQRPEELYLLLEGQFPGTYFESSAKSEEEGFKPI